MEKKALLVKVVKPGEYIFQEGVAVDNLAKSLNVK